jgi:ubiquitin carboxyl-terminal hydrolase L5
MDIFNSDLQLKNEATRRTPKTQKDDDSSSSEAGFHFIAFVPARGRVWKFDGLERQPQDLGEFGVLYR